MFENETRPKARARQKWAKAAGDHVTLSAAENQQSGQYISDLDLSMTENIRFKPARDKAQRLRSVKPSCCAAREDRPILSGELELTTGKAEVGYDEKNRDMVLGFVRHENDADGREVQENKASVRTIHGQDRFRSNDEDFSQGAMELRCEAARTPKSVLRRMGAMSMQEEGESTLDRVLPFQQLGQERQKLRQLRQLEHKSRNDRSAIHSAASGVAALAAKKQQRQMEFRKKFAKAVGKAQENRQSDDYQLYIRKKWEAMREELSAQEPFGIGWSQEEDVIRYQAPDQPALDDMPPSKESDIETERS